MKVQLTRRNNGTLSNDDIKGKVLVVDDDAGIRDIFSIILRNAGYSAEIKNNGEDLLKNNFTKPDIFLIDKQLSGLNGLDICRHLKKQKETKSIPVIMISASPDIGILSAGAGADYYIEKPFEIDYLLQVIEKYIKRSSD